VYADPDGEEGTRNARIYDLEEISDPFPIKSTNISPHPVPNPRLSEKDPQKL